VKAILDKWGYDIQTQARGLEWGVRVVKNGAVKIDGTLFKSRYGKLAGHEGKKVILSVNDCFASEYTVRDFETHATICTINF